MTFEERLEKLVRQFGTFQDIAWETMYGQKMTLGTMTDEHVENCIQYHKGVALMAEVTPSYNHLLEAANFIVFLQTKNKEMRTQ